jgi:ribosomal protein RSM22 (predicted rRNA methylase)
MSLPGDLEAAVAAWLAARPGAANRREASAALSATYRAGGTSRAIDLASYLVARLPATYAAVTRVLAELARQRPGFAPVSLLDAGSGPGTASWAALDHWPGLERITFLDNAPAFLKLAADLASHGPEPLRRAEARAGSIESVGEGQGADLVIAAYALAELPLPRAAHLAAELWRASGSVLVLVEPGTPQGFARIRAARQALLAQGAVPVAPCPQSSACPIVGEDWCHFSVRLARSRSHMHAKGARVPFEDEKFSYLVMARGGAESGGGRILAPPRHAKPGCSFRLCQDGRIGELLIARRQGALYKQAKKLDWGDLMPPATQEVSS